MGAELYAGTHWLKYGIQGRGLVAAAGGGRGKRVYVYKREQNRENAKLQNE